MFDLVLGFCPQMKGESIIFSICGLPSCGSPLNVANVCKNIYWTHTNMIMANLKIDNAYIYDYEPGNPAILATLLLVVVHEEWSSVEALSV